MQPEPTWEEIKRWRERLEGREFQQALLRFQAHVCQVFEDLRKQTGLQLIRAIIPRDEVKTIDSVVEKIVRKREEREPDERPYSFENVNDLVGIKVLCPYRKDAERVVEYLFKQNNRSLRVVENRPEDGWRDDPTGFTGYNFKVYPPIGSPATWTNLYCEVQIKTVVQEAWDAKTHDLAYKRKKAIPSRVREDFKTLSDLLNEVEKFGESVRGGLEELLAETSAHTDYAKQVLFLRGHGAAATLRELARNYEVPILEEPRELTVEEVQSINEALRRETEAGRLDRARCMLAAFIALSHKEPSQIALALQLCNDLHVRLPYDPKVEMTRGAICWALSRLTQCVEYCERASEGLRGASMTEDETAAIQSDFCYYITDATVFQTFVPRTTLEKVRDTARELLSGPLASMPNLIDTAGFVKIILGQSREEVEEGSRLVEEAYKVSQQWTEPLLKKVAEAFHSRHRRLASRRLERDF